VKERLAKLGVEPMVMTPEAFDQRIAGETVLAIELAKAAGIAIK
jgi:tripartite-type tricarboxylate transporter receptor subunit TctC